MPLTRLFVDQKLGPGSLLKLGEAESRYLGRVLRLSAGDTVRVFNGDSGEWAATVESLAKTRVSLRVGESIRATCESALKLHLVQGISRGERMDFVVQKATELGVKRVTPVLTSYGIVKLNDRRAGTRRDHWQRVARSACEQSGRTRPPLIDTPMPLNDWLGTGREAAATQLILRPGADRPLVDADAPTVKLCLLIGPEGGFSEREYDDAALAGFSPVSLGPRILRTETAAVAAVAIAQSLWGDLA